MPQDQWFIGGTHTVGKGEVACSNHAGSTIEPNLIDCNPPKNHAVRCGCVDALLQVLPFSPCFCAL